MSRESFCHKSILRSETSLLCCTSTSLDRMFKRATLRGTSLPGRGARPFADGTSCVLSVFWHAITHFGPRPSTVREDHVNLDLLISGPARPEVKAAI
jgi:hypothetical protein